MGDYNSVSFEATIEIDVNGEPLQKVYDQAWAVVTNEVGKRIMEATGEV